MRFISRNWLSGKITMTMSRRWIAFLIIADLIGDGVLYSWGLQGKENPAIYETTLVQRGDVERTVSATGRVKALVTVEVGSQLSGQIAEVNADFNDQVKNGTPLALIDRAPYEARVASS